MMKLKQVLAGVMAAAIVMTGVPVTGLGISGSVKAAEDSENVIVYTEFTDTRQPKEGETVKGVDLEINQEYSVLLLNAKANSYMWPVGWNHDGPAAWAFNGDNTNWWHTRYKDKNNTADKEENEDEISFTDTTKAKPWIGSGFERKIQLGKITYLARPENSDSIHEYVLYTANMNNPTDTPQAGDWSEAARGSMVNTGGNKAEVQEIVLDNITEATHFKLEVLSAHQNNYSSGQTTNAREIKVYEAKESASIAAWKNVLNSEIDSATAAVNALDKTIYSEASSRAVIAKAQEVYDNDSATVEDVKAQIKVLQNKDYILFSDENGSGKYLTDIADYPGAYKDVTPWGSSQPQKLYVGTEGYKDGGNLTAEEYANADNWKVLTQKGICWEHNKKFEIPLEKNKYKTFEAWAGVQAVTHKAGEVIGFINQDSTAPKGTFSVSVKKGNETAQEVYNSDQMKWNTPMKHIVVDLEDVDKLIVEIKDYSGSYDWFTVGEAKLYTEYNEKHENWLAMPEGKAVPQTPEDKTFAGWYEEPEFRTVSKRTEGKAFAKFVDKTDLYERKGGSLRCDKDDVAYTSLRFGYELNESKMNELGFTAPSSAAVQDEQGTAETVPCAWSWKWFMKQNGDWKGSTGTVNGVKIKDGVTNVVITDIPNNHFKTELTSQLFLTYKTPDGTTVEMSEDGYEDEARTVKGVAEAVVGDAEHESLAAREYAQKILDSLK